jgi:hypothetical protein
VCSTNGHRPVSAWSAGISRHSDESRNDNEKGVSGGDGGSAHGGVGGDGGYSSLGYGGGIFNGMPAILVINPRQGAKKHSSQSKTTNTITANKALLAPGGAPGSGGEATAGSGGSHDGASGIRVTGPSGSSHPQSFGEGGGVFIVATATIDFTTITGNFASSQDNDVYGTIQS